MTTTGLLGEEWLAFHRMEVTHDGRQYRIEAKVELIKYPCARTEMHAHAVCIGGEKATADDLKYCYRDLIRTYDEEFWPAIFRLCIKKAKR